MEQATRIALVLGATGGIGGEMARRLTAHGWRVRALHRDPDGLAHRDPAFEWVCGDAMVRDDVIAAARTLPSSFMPSIRRATATGPSWCCR